ncbi:MAG: hypothetical protein H6Q34_38 [Deltaproteobacteria bacterium]|nr:hypothetical protein [Deltaproteobacteria bacterium]
MIRASQRAPWLAIAFALLAGCGGYRLVRDGAVQAGAADKIKSKLVAIRGLGFRSPVPVVAVNAAEARGMLEREISHEFEPGELATIGRVYVALGLLPAGTDLEHAFLELYGSQLAGFYDPITRQMVLVNEALRTGFLTRVVETVIRRDLAGEMVLAHELTHALQDQHFGLDTGHADVGEDDAQLAVRAVYEGDATLAGFATVLGKLRPGTAASLARKLERVQEQMARDYPDIPALIRETIVFQYVAGVNFVSWAYKNAGWEGVNALLARPPRSTEQILHPEKYFVHMENPVRVQLGALAPYLRGEWQLAEEATLGEFTIRLLAERYFDRARATEFAAGWDGDRLMALAQGQELALVWLTAWDSDRDATEFFSGWATVLAGRHPGAASKSDTVIHLGGAQPYYLERRGTKVLAIEGPLESDLPALADRIWRRSTFEPNVPWVPIDLAGYSISAPCARPLRGRAPMALGTRSQFGCLASISAPCARGALRPR